uniref:Uncharacterized protein n=1 Tax=Mustela putorius furo TaxID=9669 RepID=M3YUG6_MUSPF
MAARRGAWKGARAEGKSRPGPQTSVAAAGIAPAPPPRPRLLRAAQAAPQERGGSGVGGGRMRRGGRGGAGTLVPWWKSSTDREPMKGNCMCVCVSMPPGRTSLPAASRTRRPAGAPPGGSRSRPIARTAPSSTSTSATCERSSLTTRPPRIRSRDGAAMAGGCGVLMMQCRPARSSWKTAA